MKYLKIINFLIISILAVSCQEDDLELETISVPTNLTVTSDISDDGSGLVAFSASADNAITYKYTFSDGTSAVAAGGTYTKQFTRVGLNTYLVTVVAYGKGGVSSSKSFEVEVRSDFDDPETKQLLTGGSSKTWYVASALPGNLGVGQNVDDDGNPIVLDGFFSGTPGFGPECFYDDQMTFSLNANDNLVYTYNDFGQTFVNWQFTTEFGGNGEQFVDECLEVGSATEVSASLIPASSGISMDQSTGTVIELAPNAFISYYIGQNKYEVLSIDENNMYLRAIQGNDSFLAWYIKLTTDPDGGGNTGGGEEPDFESQFNTEVWADEFEGTALDTETWNYEIGNGTDGWGNNEVQYYTEENVSVQDGHLVITARREAESGFDFTSGRITTQDKFEFTYGRVEARAKMPEGGGTWPAIWMLGANFSEVGWPATGEIDIMEWVGNSPDETSSALHFPGNSGGNAVVGRAAITNASSEFHTYTVDWAEDEITFLLDGEVFFTFTNEASLPFNKDFFFIMNVAMGGGLGGAIDPAFQESSMEVDYIRLYQ